MVVELPHRIRVEALGEVRVMIAREMVGKR